jgi:hypothetical protein
MGWFFHKGEKTCAVEIGQGEVVSVRPYSHVWIDPRAETRSQTKRLIGRGLLQRSGPPRNKAKRKRFVPSDEVVGAGAVDPQMTAFGQAITEGGGVESSSDDAAPTGDSHLPKRGKRRRVSKKVSTPDERAAMNAEESNDESITDG